MRSKLSCLTAAMIVFGALGAAHAADPKKGSSKKKSGDMLNDNFDKQMQWENNVMGPDDKKAELAKMARANAMAKAAAEKAAVEKVAAERNAAREEAKQQRSPATKTAAPVLLATPEDENAGKSTRSRNDKAGHEISPKLSTEQAAAPPPPVKPADDRFIDKLLKGEPGKKKAVVRNDDELNDLLAKDKIAPPPKPRGKRVDSVDDLLRSAEKQPDMPAPKAKTPDWAKVEAPAASAPPPVVPRAQPKRDDGVIRIVQGAAGTMSAPPSRPQVAAATPSRRSQNADTFDQRDADPFAAESPRRRTMAAKPAATFADPFADGGSPAPRARTVAAPARPVAAPSAPRLVPAARREPAPAAGWSDPFADAPAGGKAAAKRAADAKRAAPAGRSPAPASSQSPGHPPGWKDPFSDAAPVRKHGALVAMRDTPKHSATHATTWGVLKKQPRR
jgi:trimeric autotransporter adhesin